MGDGWRDVVELVARACGARVAVCHRREPGVGWVATGWAEGEGAVLPEAMRAIEDDEQLVGRVLAERVVVTERLEGLVPERLGELTGVVDGVAFGAYIGLYHQPSVPLVAWVGLPEAPGEDRLRALARLVEVAACRASCHYWTFFDRLPAAFLAVNTEGRIEFANSFLGTLGHEPMDLVGQDVTTLLAPGDWDRLHRSAESGQANHLRTLLHNAAGELVAIDFMATVSGDDGPRRLILALGLDERTERQLDHYRRLEAVDRMVSGVAHELNNPLQTVVGNAEMLSGMKLPDSAHRRATRVLAGARRCQEVVDGLLKLKRKRRDPTEAVALEGVVRRAGRRLEGEFSEDRVSFKIQVVDPVPGVNGDETDLQHAVENLLRNAFQAATERKDGEVELRLEGSHRHVQIAVSDNGDGMSPEVRDRAFEPFFTTRAVGSGKGLGLSIALGIIEEHGGLIELQPRASGTRVVVSLPTAKGGALNGG